MAILKEQPEAVLASQHIGERRPEIGFPRGARGLGGQPVEELIHQRPGQVLTDGMAMIGG